jgi:hypothetical protein
VAVQPGGELAEEVEVFVSVGVVDARSLGVHDRQRERFDMENAARVSAGHDARALVVQPLRLGVALDVAPCRLLEPWHAA